MFVEKYLKSLNTSDLRDDKLHHHTDALAAAALADLSAGRARSSARFWHTKYADGTHHNTFEADNRNFSVLLRAWTKLVTQKGLDRKWLEIKHEWNIKAEYGIYEKIARVSLAHWLQGECEGCNGTKITAGRASRVAPARAVSPSPAACWRTSASTTRSPNWTVCIRHMAPGLSHG